MSTATSTATATAANTVEVYTAGFTHVMAFPRRAVHQMPPTQAGVSRLVLCSNYDPAKGARSCPMGTRCKFLHGDARSVKRQAVHVNYAWRRVEDVSYERFDAGTLLHVAPPNCKTTLDTMDSGLVIRTRALASKRRPLTHCAHFYFNRACNLGCDCQFIHAVFIDPKAKDHQRAPVPSQLGKGRETLLSKKQREARQREVDEHMKAQAAAKAHHHHHDATATVMLPTEAPFAASTASSRPDRHHDDHAHLFGRQQDALLVAGTASLSSGAMSRPLSPSGSESGLAHAMETSLLTSTPMSMTAAAAPALGSTASSVLRLGTGPRFRYDPYSLVSCRVVLF